MLGSICLYACTCTILHILMLIIITKVKLKDQLEFKIDWF